ncbi:urea amidolyase associated protein UAAP1 [Rhodoferax sp.]|uniref:urea amidolyase associated protein UAAP1 n=1 Tax=Rhodoferax sp. TaxID=50421 RepID=UPI00283DE534|nr:urea amidolyase associated protein UAAP1 [Rhodoferax sp.]MDR3371725.1 urea carboxylase-associated family protein [Rhodoferax sp.]
MSITFADLPALARDAVPEASAKFSPELVLWDESLPGGCHWSGLLRRGNTLRVTDLQGTANVATLFFNQEEKTERYNMPDTLKAQHTAYLTQGHVCYSDMGRVLCSITEDTCGWHDTFSGVLDTPHMIRKYGEARYQQHRNSMHRSGLDGLVVELNKWGLGRRDLNANVNLFSKVVADASGKLGFVTEHRQPGQYVDLRFEMNVLVLLSAAPHPLDPNPSYAPGSVQLTAWRSGTAGATDPCRLSCPENDRGFINTERWFL